MNKKTIFILLVVLAILAAVGRHLLVQNSAPEGSDVMGSSLFIDLPANELVAITIERPGDSAVLKKNQSGWIVENRFGYSADFTKLTDLIRKMKETKIGRKFPATESVRKRLSLMSPACEECESEEKGTRMWMKNGDGAIVVDILLGKPRQREEKGIPDSQFVMLGQGPDIYLVDQIFSPFETAAATWLKKNPVQLKKDDIYRITCTGPDGAVRYSVERPEEGQDFQLLNPPKGRTVRQSAINRLAGALSGLEIEDVSDPSSPPESLEKGVSPRIDYTLYNGMVYHVYPGLTCSPGIPCYLRLQADFYPPAGKTRPVKNAEAGEKKDDASKKSDRSLASEAAGINDRLSPWVFVVPQWQHEAFVTSLEEMLEAEKKDDTAEK